MLGKSTDLLILSARINVQFAKAPLALLQRFLSCIRIRHHSHSRFGVLDLLRKFVLDTLDIVQRVHTGIDGFVLSTLPVVLLFA